MRAIDFEILGRSSECAARAGRVTTLHGVFETPAFMPVGTKASVKGLLPDQVRAVGSQIILANTYHLMLRPGSELIARRGGLQKFTDWQGPMLTDSGGFQVFSLGDINKIDEDGVTFKSHLDGSAQRLTPERSMQVQNELGADIIMAFDDCPPPPPPPEVGNAEVEGGGWRAKPQAAGTVAAADRTARWLERCVAAHGRGDEQALFGIIQGGTDLELRRRCVDQVCGFDLPGYAIGGVAVGEPAEEIAKVVGYTAPLMPLAKPRYLMGVGYERDILAAVEAGVDMFDCVLPTRNGRNANAFTRGGQIRLRNAKYAEDDGPIDGECGCPVCGRFSRAYIRHLFMSEEMLGPILVSWHNIAHFQALMLDIRRAIREDSWSLLRSKWSAG